MDSIVMYAWICLLFGPAILVESAAKEFGFCRLKDFSADQPRPLVVSRGQAPKVTPSSAHRQDNGKL